jgi:hypothetical protein
MPVGIESGKREITSSGVAAVATSQSLGGTRRNMSRTHPPTTQAGYPWDERILNTFLTYFGGVMSTMVHHLKVLAIGLSRDYNKHNSAAEVFFILPSRAGFIKEQIVKDCKTGNGD